MDSEGVEWGGRVGWEGGGGGGAYDESYLEGDVGGHHVRRGDGVEMASEA